METRRTVLRVVGGGLLAAGVGAKVAAVPAAAVGGRAVAGTLVVVEKSGHAVAFHDVADGTLLGRVELDEYPHEMVIDSAGEHAYIGHYGVRMSGDPGVGGSSMFVVDLAARRLVRTIDLSPFNRLHGIAIDDRDRLYALGEEKGRSPATGPTSAKSGPSPSTARPPGSRSTRPNRRRSSPCWTSTRWRSSTSRRSGDQNHRHRARTRRHSPDLNRRSTASLR